MSVKHAADLLLLFLEVEVVNKRAFQIDDHPTLKKYLNVDGDVCVHTICPPSGCYLDGHDCNEKFNGLCEYEGKIQIHYFI